MSSDQRGLMATYAAAIAKRYRVHHHELIAEAMQARTFVAKIRMLYRESAAREYGQSRHGVPIPCRASRDTCGRTV